jgi:hypothetical protein
MKTAEEAKALLAEKPLLQGFRIFREVTTQFSGSTKEVYYIKERMRPFGWKWVKRRGNFRHKRILPFESEHEARTWIERQQPPKKKLEEVPL